MNAQNKTPEFKAILGASLEALINQLISLDEETSQSLNEIEGKFISLEVSDLALLLTFHIQAPGIRLMTEFHGREDTLIITNSKTITEMGLQRFSGSQGSLHGKLEITGDIETGQKFKTILDSLDIDWEEHLAHITGDVIAHQLFRTLGKLKTWGKESWEHFTQDSSAWLTDEKHLSPHIHELDDFSKQVSKIRNDVERVAARLQHLERQLNQQD